MGKLIEQFLHVSVNDDPPDGPVPAYTPSPGLATEDGKEEEVKTGLRGDAGGVSIGEDKDEDEAEDIPRDVYGRGVVACEANRPLAFPSIFSSPTLGRSVVSD